MSDQPAKPDEQTPDEVSEAPSPAAPGPEPAAGFAGSVAASEDSPPEPFTGETDRKLATSEVDGERVPESASETADAQADWSDATKDAAEQLRAATGEGDAAMTESTQPDVAEQVAEQPTVEELGDLDDPELDGEPEPEVEAPPAGPVEIAEEEDEEIEKRWYILKVQSNRERSIAAALQRKVAIEGIDHLFGQILVPTEKVTEFKGGKKKVVERKLWPGYIAVEMHVNDDTWFAIRETGGIGDFTGSGGAPTPMQPSEVAKILPSEESETEEESPKLNIKFAVGDKVKVKDGNFESFEGEVDTIDEASGKISVMISIFGRSTPVELDYWQVEKL